MLGSDLGRRDSVEYFLLELHEKRHDVLVFQIEPPQSDHLLGVLQVREVGKRQGEGGDLGRPGATDGEEGAGRAVAAAAHAREVLAQELGGGVSVEGWATVEVLLVGVWLAGGAAGMETEMWPSRPVAMTTPAQE